MKTIMVAAIGFYRKWISPLTPGSCRFAPTCSEYGQQALERHGVWKGTFLTAGRLMRCHPFHPGGYDPVPGKAVSKVPDPWVSGKDVEPVEPDGRLFLEKHLSGRESSNLMVPCFSPEHRHAPTPIPMTGQAEPLPDHNIP